MVYSGARGSIMLVLSSHRRVSPSSPSSILLFFRPSWYIRKKESFRHCVVYLGVVVGAFACTKVVCRGRKPRLHQKKGRYLLSHPQPCRPVCKMREMGPSLYIGAKKNFQMQQPPGRTSTGTGLGLSSRCRRCMCSLVRSYSALRWHMRCSYRQAPHM